jgi:hypothetical protein
MRAILIFGMGIFVGFVLAQIPLMDRGNGEAQKLFKAALADYDGCTSYPNNESTCERLRHIMDATAVAAGRR